MTDVNFDQIIEELKSVHSQFPTLRFGDIVQAAMDRHKNQKNTDLSDITTKDFLTGIQKYHIRLVNKEVGKLDKQEL